MIARTIITVDGIDGSGKSTFAHNLLDRLDGRGALISIDYFRRPIDWARAGASETELYYDAYYDFAACEACLRAFLAGAPSVSIPRFDSVSERIEGTRELHYAGASVAVVEGVFPLRLAATADHLVIYLEVNPAEARHRIIERDLRKGRTRAEIERRIDRRYAPGQDRYNAAHQPRARADVVIDNQQPARPRVLARDLSRLPEPLRPMLDRVLPPLA